MSNKNPTVSVIIPTYNRAHLVGRAIRSVLGQTYQDFELIVVDDASTDDTEEVVRGFDDPCIRYMRHDENRGGSAARNTGIRAARGEYVAFLDSDDEWLPTKLERQLQVFDQASSELGLVYTGFRSVELESKLSLNIHLPYARGNILRSLLKRNVVGTPSTTLVRRTVLKKSGLFDESLRARQDADLWIRLARHCTFDYVPEILAIIYIHANRITEDAEARIEGSKRVFEKIREDLEKDKRLLSEGQFFMGRELCKGGYSREGRDYIKGAIKTFPFRLKYYGGFLASFLGAAKFRCIQDAWGTLKSWIANASR